MDYPALCTCKMVQGSGSFHLETVGLCFVRKALPFPGKFCFAHAGFSGEFCFAAAKVEVSAPVTACTVGAAVAELHSLCVEKN